MSSEAPSFYTEDEETVIETRDLLTAARLNVRQADDTYQDALSARQAAIAQTQATIVLAEYTADLVEQQRIANLIAFVQSVTSVMADGSLPNALVMRRVEKAGDMILAGLGLS